nr:MAG TPA: hypothetical protein [Caudoviricetes sp.]
MHGWPRGGYKACLSSKELRYFLYGQANFKTR